MIRDQQRNRGTKGVPEDLVRSVMKSCLQGLAYIHDRGVFHRDLKPENLLYDAGKVKICDFGLSKDFGQATMPHTNYVSTRWYRAPEVIFRSNSYDDKVDIFALGCIFAEMYTGDPLMPGSSEADQLMRMGRLIGQPPSQWALAK